MTAVLAVGLFGLSAATVNAVGASPSQRLEAAVVDSSRAEVYVSINAVRVLDTRPAPVGPIGVSTAAPLQPGQQLDLAVAGSGRAVPAEATAVVVNSTIDFDATMPSFLTIWPTGQSRPLSSVNNAVPGIVASNVTIVRTGTGGSISIYNQQGQANLVLDVVGYMIPLDKVSGIGTGNTLLSGSGAPDPGTGNDGDYYIDTSTHQIYGPKTNGNWGPTTSLVGPAGPAGAAGATGATGPAGASSGTQIRNGTGVPSGGTGIDGDYYIDNSTHILYGPKTGGVWGAGVSLIGPAGTTGATGATGAAGAAGATGATGAAGTNGSSVQSGSGAPSGATGANGDFYIDTVSHQLYGPKSGGAWGSATSLVGPAGATGAAGAAGATGAAGPTGPQGIAGGVIDAISASSSGLLIATLLTDVPLSFPTPGGVVVGSEITQTNNTTFTVSATGKYKVTYRFMSGVAVSLGNSIKVKANTTQFGQSNALLLANTPVFDTVLVSATAGDTIQVLIGGLINAGVSYTAAVEIERIA